MNEKQFNDWLDERAAALPRDVAPGRDLWPGIHARLTTDLTPTGARAGGHERFWQFAAGVAATALVAVLALQFSQRDSAPAPEQAAVTQPAAQQDITPDFATPEPQWLPGVRRARNDLVADYQASLDNLSPETRAIVEENLAQIHKSLAEIHDALAEDPSNAALHRLLAGTYQQELNLFSSIGALNTAETQL